MYCGSTVTNKKHSEESHLDLSSIILEEAADSGAQTSKDATPLMSNNVKVMIREELTEMQQTLEEIQQTMPTFPNRCTTPDILQDAKTTSARTARIPVGDGGLPHEEGEVAV